MITLYQLGPAGYWTGQTQQVEDDAVVPSGWTARPLPEGLQEGQDVRLTLAGWEITTEPAPVAIDANLGALPRPALVITSIEPDATHASQALINGVADVTCPAGTVLTVHAELRDAAGAVLPLTDSFRMPLRSRDGREKVLLAVMDNGVVSINAPLRESGAWSVTEAMINESMPPDHQMGFAGFQVFVVEV